MSILLWLESTRIATFVRESLSLLAYPTFSTVHTIGLGIIVGLSTVVALRLLGFAPTLPLAPLNKLFPTMWFAFAINLLSGSGLLAADARKLAPHPLFIVKIICVFAAVAILGVLQVKVFRHPELGNKPLDARSKVLAGSLLVLWLLAMFCGRLIAYTFATTPVPLPAAGVSRLLVPGSPPRPAARPSEGSDFLPGPTGKNSLPHDVLQSRAGLKNARKDARGRMESSLRG